MESFDQNVSKIPGIYRCPDDIKNFKIRIKIKKSHDSSFKFASEKWIETKFSWQEKRFSKFHKEFYAEEKNCITELEKEYHQKIIKITDRSDDFVFSYTNQDRISETDFGPVISNAINPSPTYLQKNVIVLLETPNKNIGEDSFDFQKDILRAIENPIMFESTEDMVIMIDLGEYIQNKWVKNEVVLCRISFNKSSKCLKITPDFTRTQPYVLNFSKSGEEIKYHYFLENCSKEMPDGISMNEKSLINKLNNLKISLKMPSLPPFQLPPKNKLVVFLFFEISSGRNFAKSDVYVEYFIDLPKNWSCQNRNDSTGRTQMCRGGGGDSLVHFGHVFDIVLEYDIQDMKKQEPPKSPYIYFEVVSKDSWERHRSEGLTYQILPISTSGRFEYHLNCFRFSKSFLGELRRFFIGDYRNFDDLTWIGIPTNHEGSVLNKFGTKTISTGQLNLKINVIHQSQAFLEKFGATPDKNRRDQAIFEKLRSSSLIRSVEEVLLAFKKARREMLEAKVVKKMD